MGGEPTHSGSWPQEPREDGSAHSAKLQAYHLVAGVPCPGCPPCLKRVEVVGDYQYNVPKRGSGTASTLIKYLLIAKAGHKPKEDREARKYAPKD